jgi:hypothetical protein
MRLVEYRGRGLRLGVWLLLAACCVVLVAAVVPMTLAQTGYDLSWWTVDGGGATLITGEGYRLSGTAGQPDAGVLAGGGYALLGGFWRGGKVGGQSYVVYLPLVMR